MSYKFCPHCNSIVETRINPSGYKQMRYQNSVLKRRKIIHRVQDGGCGQNWFTYEVPEDLMRRLAITLFHPEMEI